MLLSTSGGFYLGENGGGGGGGGGNVCFRCREPGGSSPLDSVVSFLSDRYGLVVTARSRTKKGSKETPPIIPQRELLGLVRNRKNLAWLQREQELSQENNNVPKVWPFWRKKNKSEMESRALTKRIMELSQRQQLDEVLKLAEDSSKENQSLPIIIMNAIMEACVHCDDVDRAVGIYREMLLPGNCGVDSVTYGILLKGLGQARRLDDAFELTEAIEAGRAPGKAVLSDVHLNTLVNACVEAGDPLRARGVLLRYRSSSQGLKSSVLTYNLLIKGCGRSDNPLDALKLKEEMRLLELQPQRVTYNSLIFACVRGGDMDKALEIFQEMKLEARRLNTSRLLPDVVTCTTLLKGLADCSDIEGVARLVSEMKISPTCVLDRVAYTAIIDAFISAGSPTEGLRFFEQEMMEKAKDDPQFKPKPHVFLSLMRAFALKGEMEIVRSLRQQMVPGSAGKKCVEDRAEADELLIETAVNAGQLGVAQQVLKTMIGLKKGIPLSKRAHMVLVRLQALLGYSQDLFKPFLLKPGISPYVTVENIMSPYKMARPLLGNVQLKSVIMRFFKEDAIPVIDAQGGFIGVVYSEDCFRMDSRLCDIMRPLPPEVTNSTLVARAVSLLLQPQVKMVVVVDSRNLYPPSRSSSREPPLGFISRETIFSNNDSLLPVKYTSSQTSGQ